MARSLIVENLCPHGYPVHHGPSRSACKEGKVVTLLDGQAIKVKGGFIIDVTDIMDAVLADTARPSVS